MKTLTLEEIKTIEYDILSEVAAFCDGHEIRYYLACGTLLGAIRHGGFIPWDDDVDIAMPRPDYERFIREYTSSTYTLHDFRIDEAYPYPFAKVSDLRTCLIEETEEPAKLGVYIDIFPIDGLPEDPKQRKEFFKTLEWDRRLLSWKRISRRKKVGFVHKIIQVFSKLALKPVSVQRLVRRYDAHIQRFSYETARSVGHFATMAVWGSDEKPKTIFESAVKHKFERGMFNVPGGYDAYLVIEYGDYMELPPKEQQVSKHSYSVCWREE